MTILWIVECLMKGKMSIRVLYVCIALIKNNKIMIDIMLIDLSEIVCLQL